MYLDFFDPKQFKIIIFEEFISDTQKTLDEIFQFLRVKSFNINLLKLQRYNESNNRSNFSTDQQKLNENNYHKLLPSIENDIKKMEGFLGRSLSLWDLSEAKWIKKNN